MIVYNKGKYNLSYERIAAYHWNLINPKTKKGKYHKSNSLIGRVETAKTKFIIDGKLSKVKFLRFLTNNNYKFLNKLITLPPQELNKTNKKIVRVLKKYNLYKNTSFYTELLNTIFSYKTWRASINFQKTFNLMYIPVCPYCNLNEIYNYSDETRAFIVTSLDHYYDKARFPYLSLTFSNLIPVCKQCNETFKGESTFTYHTHIHPYVDSYNKHCKFTNSIVLDKQDDIIVAYNSKDNRARKTNADLGILGRYNTLNNKREAMGIYNLQKVYPESRKKELMSLMKLNSIEEFEQYLCLTHLIPFDQVEIRINQKGKLKRDIAIEYQLLTDRD